MARLIVADAAAGVFPGDGVAGVVALLGLAVLVQQLRAEFPHLVGRFGQNVIHRVLAGAEGLHTAVVVQHADIIGGLVVVIDLAVSHQKAGALVVGIVSVDGQDGPGIDGHAQ